MVRIYSKLPEHPLKVIFEEWACSTESASSTLLKELLHNFNELKDQLELENIAEDFAYTKEGGIGLSRQVEYINNTENHSNNKETQVRNVESILETDICMFTDGSSLGNPGPTGAGACIYPQGLNSTAICLKQAVHPNSNNFVGEIQGILLKI